MFKLKIFSFKALNQFKRFKDIKDSFIVCFKALPGFQIRNLFSRDLKLKVLSLKSVELGRKVIATLNKEFHLVGGNSNAVTRTRTPHASVTTSLFCFEPAKSTSGVRRSIKRIIQQLLLEQPIYKNLTRNIYQKVSKDCQTYIKIY